VRLASLVRPELIFSDLPEGDRKQVLRSFSERIAGLGLVQNAEQLYRQLWEREQLGSTGIGSGIAIPHCKIAGLRSGIVALGLVPQGVDFGAADGKPVRLFFLVISPDHSPAEHLQILAAISRWIKADQHAERLLELREPAAIYDFLQREGV
jgi:PTS system nitrogen regulatory IIA component